MLAGTCLVSMDLLIELRDKACAEARSLADTALQERRAMAAHASPSASEAAASAGGPASRHASLIINRPAWQAPIPPTIMSAQFMLVAAVMWQQHLQNHHALQAMLPDRVQPEATSITVSQTNWDASGQVVGAACPVSLLPYLPRVCGTATLHNMDI